MPKSIIWKAKHPRGISNANAKSLCIFPKLTILGRFRKIKTDLRINLSTQHTNILIFKHTQFTSIIGSNNYLKPWLSKLYPPPSSDPKPYTQYTPRDTDSNTSMYMLRTRTHIFTIFSQYQNRNLLMWFLQTRSLIFN